MGIFPRVLFSVCKADYFKIRLMYATLSTWLKTFWAHICWSSEVSVLWLSLARSCYCSKNHALESWKSMPIKRKTRMEASLSAQGWLIWSWEEKERTVCDMHARVKSLITDGAQANRVENMNYHCAEGWFLEKKKRREQRRNRKAKVLHQITRFSTWNLKSLFW